MIILGLGLFASGIACYKIPLQYHFFEETDFSGKGAWYYIWQQYVLPSSPFPSSLFISPLQGRFLSFLTPTLNPLP